MIRITEANLTALWNLVYREVAKWLDHLMRITPVSVQRSDITKQIQEIYFDTVGKIIKDRESLELIDAVKAPSKLAHILMLLWAEQHGYELKGIEPADIKEVFSDDLTSTKLNLFRGQKPTEPEKPVEPDKKPSEIEATPAPPPERPVEPAALSPRDFIKEELLKAGATEKVADELLELFFAGREPTQGEANRVLAVLQELFGTINPDFVPRDVVKELAVNQLITLGYSRPIAEKMFELAAEKYGVEDFWESSQSASEFVLRLYESAKTVIEPRFGINKQAALDSIVALLKTLGKTDAEIEAFINSQNIPDFVTQDELDALIKAAEKFSAESSPALYKVTSTENWEKWINEKAVIELRDIEAKIGKDLPLEIDRKIIDAAVDKALDKLEELIKSGATFKDISVLEALLIGIIRSVVSALAVSEATNSKIAEIRSNAMKRSEDYWATVSKQILDNARSAGIDVTETNKKIEALKRLFYEKLEEAMRSISPTADTQIEGARIFLLARGAIDAAISDLMYIQKDDTVISASDIQAARSIVKATIKDQQSFWGERLKALCQSRGVDFNEALGRLEQYVLEAMNGLIGTRLKREYGGVTLSRDAALAQLVNSIIANILTTREDLIVP